VRPTILMVENQEDSRAMYAYALSARGFDIVVADDAGVMPARARQVRPDVIVIDLMSPDHDRWTAVRELKRDVRTRDIAIVIIPVQTSPSERERAERECCAAVCARPCTPQTLAYVLQAVLDRHTVSAAAARR